MRTFFCILSALFLLTSCAEQYNIAGNSSVEGLEGKKLYLRFSPDGYTNSCIDSCEVVHGCFSFMGSVDSIFIAHLCMGNENVMPVVIENGNLTVQMDKVMQRVSGGPLNERLYDFFRKKERLENEMWEAEMSCMRMLREGKKLEDVKRCYARKTQALSQRLEEMEVQFVKDNYNNPLGPGFFMLLCSQFPSPVMTEQISRIINNAPNAFMQNPFVNNYVRQARNSRPDRREGKGKEEDGEE